MLSVQLGARFPRRIEGDAVPNAAEPQERDACSGKVNGNDPPVWLLDIEQRHAQQIAFLRKRRVVFSASPRFAQ